MGVGVGGVCASLRDVRREPRFQKKRHLNSRMLTFHARPGREKSPVKESSPGLPLAEDTRSCCFHANSPDFLSARRLLCHT